MHFSTKRRSWQQKPDTTPVAPSPLSQSASATPSVPTSAPRNPARSVSVPLIVVPDQNNQQAHRTAPPSSFRNYSRTASIPGAKGKERQREPDLPTPSRSGWAQWLMDPLEARRGAEVWSQGERVILVLGEPTIATLSPLLYSPAFSNTLILVGSIQPLPEIESLTSPSHLMSLDDGRTMYPTILPFQPPPGSLKGTEHPLHTILKQATLLADNHKQALTTPETATRGSRPSSWASGRSRRNSGTSTTGTMTPPLQQSGAKRFGTWGRRSAVPSPMGSPSGSHTDLSRIASQTGKGRTPSIMSVPADRPRTLRRISSFLGKEDPRVCEGSPFDAVIDFIPSAGPYADNRRVLHDMLQHATVLTTAVLPIMTTAATNNSVSAATALTELAPLSVLHIVPSDAPPALAPVIERFLMPLLPLASARTRRNLFGCITGPGPWMATIPDSNGGAPLPAAEILLFGGLRSLVENNLRPQALLSSWDNCLTSHGTLVEASQREEDAPPSAFSRRASSQALSELRTVQLDRGAPLYIPGGINTSPTSPTRALPPGALPPIARSTSRTISPPALLPLRTQLETSTSSSASSKSSGSRFDPRNGGSIGYSPSELQSPISLQEGKPAAVPRSPSGLRNSLQTAFQTSPPTPELDPSSSSCSSSSVLEVPTEIVPTATRNIPSVPNGKPAIPKSRTLGSIFRRSRSGVKA